MSLLLQKDLSVKALLLNSAMLIFVRFVAEEDVLCMWTVTRLFMFGPFIALLALCQAEMMAEMLTSQFSNLWWQVQVKSQFFGQK